MNILFLRPNRFIRNELRECVSDMQGQAYFAASTEEAVTILNAQPIDIFFLELKECTETGLLKYIYEHFKNVRIILTAESGIKDAISIIRKTHFDVLRKPFALKEVRDILVGHREGLKIDN